MYNKNKLEISEILNEDITIERYHCIGFEYEELYNYYLTRYNIKLQYHNKDLMKYIEEQRKSLYDEENNEIKLQKFKKKQQLLLIRKCVFRTSLFLGLCALHVAKKDIIIHQESNVMNSYVALKDLSTDLDDDGIIEFNTLIIESIDYYSNPIDDIYYKNTNLFYNLNDELKIADNVSFMIAMDKLNYEVIEIDGIKYSDSGKISEITYRLNNEKKKCYSDREFITEEEIKKYLIEKYSYQESDVITNIISKTSDISMTDEICSIYKNKNDGTTTIKQDENIEKIKSKIIKMIYNL